jgi:hypothetical protein
VKRQEQPTSGGKHMCHFASLFLEKRHAKPHAPPCLKRYEKRHCLNPPLGFLINEKQLFQRDFKRTFHLKGSNEHIHR